MTRNRLAPLLLRLWLVLSLGAMPFVPVAGAHAAGTMPDHGQHQAGGDQADHCQAPTGGTQHDHCNGLCCASCAHCTAVTAESVGSGQPCRTTLVPHEPQLLAFAYLPPRERPPRMPTV